MSLTFRYLDIDSTYRDRNRYPSQFDFVIPISINGQKPNAQQALDPVSLAFPYVTNSILATSTNTITINDSVPPVNVSPFDDYYIESYVEAVADNPNAEFRRIIGYNATSYANPVITYTGATMVATSGNFNIRYAIPLFIGAVGATPASTTTTINLGPTASNMNDFYTGNFLRFRNSAAGTPTALTGLYRIITAYNGATQTATLSTPLPSVPAVTDGIEVNAYTNDNAFAMIYSGTMTMNQPVCYSVELLSLVLPTFGQPTGMTAELFANGIGGNWDRYPYVYLHLYNESSNFTNYRTLYSNNPNSNRALFKVPMSIFSGDNIFFTLKDAKTIQVVKFRPDLPLRFTITFPNGQIPEIVPRDAAHSVSPNVVQIKEQYSPNPPNSLVQVNAIFALNRIVNEK